MAEKAEEKVYTEAEVKEHFVSKEEYDQLSENYKKLAEGFNHLLAEFNELHLRALVPDLVSK